MERVNQFPLGDVGLAAAAAAVADGSVIVLPTDTVYGIGADPFSESAVQKLLDAKQRGAEMPPPVLVAEPSMLRALVAKVPPAAKALADAFWPGPLTLILTEQKSLGLHLGETRGTVAVRVPDHDGARELLRRTGPLAVSSANISGRPAATTCGEAVEQLGETVEVYLDDGPSPGAVASTIVDFSSGEDGVVLRLGALDLARLQEVAEGVRMHEPEPAQDAETRDDAAEHEPEVEPAEPTEAEANEVEEPAEQHDA